MIATLGAILAGLFAAIAGLFAALLGLGVGLGALSLVLIPLLLVMLIPLLPVLLLIAALRFFGVIHGVLQSLAVLVLGLVALIIVAHYSWLDGVDAARDWLEDNREVLEACSNQENANITLEMRGGLHLTCTIPKKSDGNPSRRI